MAPVVARAAGWLLLGALYAAATLTLDPVVESVQDPLVLESLDGDGRVLVLAACAALAFAFAGALARQTVPDPWASRAAVVAALSPAGFLLAGSTAAPPAALLTAGLLGALRTRDNPTRFRTLGGAACLALTPWFGIAFALPAAGVLLATSYWSFRRGRRLYGFLALEFGGASAVTLGGVNISEATGPVPGIDRIGELLIAAPVLALGVASLAIVLRARRDRLSAAIRAWRDAEVAVGLTVLAIGATLLAALLEPVGPEAAVPAAAALVALALRGFRRIAGALALLTLGFTVWRVAVLAAGSADSWLPLG